MQLITQSLNCTFMELKVNRFDSVSEWHVP